jgi:uncharacterized protein YjiS (DUF1127 family)
MAVRATYSRPQILMSGTAAAPVSSQALADKSWTARLASGLRRWRAAYAMWRSKRAALIQLAAMSERDLKDIGLTRGEIENTVWDEDRAAASVRRAAIAHSRRSNR